MISAFGAIKKIKNLRGALYKRMQSKRMQKASEAVVPEVLSVEIRKTGKIIEFPPLTDPTTVNVTYSLIEPFAYANIKWDPVNKELKYNVVEPELSEDEKKLLEAITEALLELIEVLPSTKNSSALVEYLQEQFNKVLKDLGITLTQNQYSKLFYYLYRNFAGYNEVEVFLQDPNIEDISCDGINTPLYVIHRHFGSLKTNVIFQDLGKLREFVVKLAERCGRYVSYAEPILDGTLPDGSRVSATIAGDVATRGPTFCIKEGFVQFADGSLKLISNFFEECKTARLEIKNGAEILHLSNKYAVGVYDKLEQKKAKILTAVKLPPPEKLVEVFLEDGRKITVTQNHLFHVLGEDDLKLVEAEWLTSSDYLPVPTEIRAKGRKQKINVLKFLENSPLRFHCSKSGFRFPSELNEKLAYIAGLLLSRGSLRRNYFSIRLHRLESAVRNEIVQALNELFKTCKVRGNVAYVHSRPLAYYMQKVFEIPYGSKASAKVPDLIAKSDNKVLASFLRGFFSSSAAKSLSCKTASKHLAYALPFLLARLGIYSIVQEKNGYRILIPPSYEKVFLKKIGFGKCRKQKLLGLLRKRTNAFADSRLPNVGITKLVEENGIKVSDLTKKLKVSSSELSAPKISKKLLKRILAFIEKETAGNPKNMKRFEYLRWLAVSKNEFVKVKEIFVRENLEKTPVYDIELNPTKFFIGGLNGPLNLFDTIRKFGEKPFSPIDQILAGTADAAMLAYFWYLIEHGASMLIVGGVSTGKTSFLNSVAMFIPPEAKIISIEDTREIRIPHQHWIAGLARTGFGIPMATGAKYGEVSLFDLLRESFRQNPDYVIVGEVRGEETYVMFQGMSSGHPSISTFHAGSVETVIKRLTTPPIQLSPTLIESLDVIAVMAHAREKGKSARRIKEVVEIISVDPKAAEVKTNVVFRWNPATDKYERINPSVKLEKYATARGATLEDALQEVARREKILKWLLQKNVKDYKEFTSYVNTYYKEPQKILSLLQTELKATAETELKAVFMERGKGEETGKAESLAVKVETKASEAKPKREEQKEEPKTRKSILELLGYKIVKEKL